MEQQSERTNDIQDRWEALPLAIDHLYTEESVTQVPPAPANHNSDHS